MRIYFLIVSFFLYISCSAQTDILFTDFQSGIPSNYSIVDNDGLSPDVSVSEYTNAWIALVDPDNANNTLASSTSYFSPVGAADRWLITPPLSLGVFGNSLEWKAMSKDASFPDDYLVMVSTTDNQLNSFKDTIGYIIEENAEWTTRTVNLSSYGYNNQTIYVAFRNITDDGFKLYIDDIHAWVDDPASMLELEKISLVVSPNPTNNIVSVQTNSKVEKLELIDMNGNVLIVSPQSTIDLSGLNQGFYNLHIVTQNGLFYRKVVKI